MSTVSQLTTRSAWHGVVLTASRAYRAVGARDHDGHQTLPLTHQFGRRRKRASPFSYLAFELGALDLLLLLLLSSTSHSVATQSTLHSAVSSLQSLPRRPHFYRSWHAFNARSCCHCGVKDLQPDRDDLCRRPIRRVVGWSATPTFSWRNKENARRLGLRGPRRSAILDSHRARHRKGRTAQTAVSYEQSRESGERV